MKNKMNKKGIAPLLVVTFAGVVIAFILLGFFLFSGTLRFILIGIGIIIGAFWVIGQMIGSNVTGPKIGVILVLLGVGVLFIFGSGFIQQGFFGASDFEISTNGRVVRILVTPEGDELFVNLNRDELNRELRDEGFTVERGVDINIISEELKFSYDLRRTNANFESFNFNKEGTIFIVTFPPETSRLIQICQERGRTDTFHAFVEDLVRFTRHDLFCVSPTLTASRGDVSGGQTNEFKVRVDVGGGGSRTLTRNNLEDDFFGGDIKVRMEGFLVAPEEISEVPFDVLVSTGGIFIKLIEEGGIGRQSGARINYQDCVRPLSEDDQDRNFNCITEYLNELGRILENQDDQFAPNQVRSIDFVGNKMIVDVVPSTSRIPLITITVDGTFIGLRELQGDPQITSCVDDIRTVNAREEELRGEITIKNVGNDRGTFSISRECTNPRLDVLLPSRISIDRGDEETLVAIITGNTESPGQTETGRCTITVRDDANVDSCDFNIEIEFPETICNADTLLCSNDNTQVLECNEFGDGTEVIQTCSSDEICSLNDIGQVDCVKEGFDFKDIFDDDGRRDGGDRDLDDLKTACNERAQSNPLAGWTFIETETCGFLCGLGFGEPTVSGECKASFVPFYVFGGVILLIGFGAIVAFTRRPKKRTARRRR